MGCTAVGADQRRETLRERQMRGYCHVNGCFCGCGLAAGGVGMQKAAQHLCHSAWLAACACFCVCLFSHTNFAKESLIQLQTVFLPHHMHSAACAVDVRQKIAAVEHLSAQVSEDRKNNVSRDQHNFSVGFLA